MTSRSRLLIVVIVGLLVVTGIALGFILSRQGPASNIPTPQNWRQMQQFGEIADPCLGGWTECGSITTIYDTHQSPGMALTQLRETLTAARWVVFVDSSSPATIKARARNRPGHWDKIVYITLTDGQARIEYIQQ
jgi:hypothetical protein